MDYNNKIIDEIAKDLNIPRSKVERVTKFFFSWQQEKFIECENIQYNWKYFCKFNIIEKRYDKYKQTGILPDPSRLLKKLNQKKRNELLNKQLDDKSNADTTN